MRVGKGERGNIVEEHSLGEAVKLRLGQWRRREETKPALVNSRECGSVAWLKLLSIVTGIRVGCLKFVRDVSGMH